MPFGLGCCQRDVGIHPIAHHPRFYHAARSDQVPDGLMRFARNFWFPTSRDRNRSDKRTCARKKSCGGRERRISVGCQKSGTRAHRCRGPGDAVVSDVPVHAHDDRSGFLRILGHLDTDLNQGVDNTDLPYDHRRLVFESQERSCRLGRRDYLRRVGGDASHDFNLGCHLSRRACRVVCHVGDSSSSLCEPSQGLGCTRDSHIPSIEDTVEVADDFDQGLKKWWSTFL